MESPFIRYDTPISKIFSEESKLQYWLKVEAALAQAHAKLNNIPSEAAKEIERKANIKFVKVNRVKEIDKEIHHDLMAMVKALEEQCEGDAGNYIHLGATSYDTEDTATALQLIDALTYLEGSILKILITLINLAERNKKLICIGRTHGQHAIPTTYGMRFGIWAYEFSRHLDRLEQVKERIQYGKMSGAVGTMASFSGKGFEIQQEVMKQLGLNPVLIANQVIQRDRIAEVILLTTLIAGTCDKIARQFRILQRSEIGEMFEPFKEKKQVGSSTMPHKRNPHKSETICSLGRVIKSNAIVALDNIVLEDERDITNSASERVIVPENFTFLDFILTLLERNLRNLELNEVNIKKNLNLTKGAILSEKIMIELVKKGIGRQDAHELLRKAIIKARKENKYIKEILMENKDIKKNFSNQELDEITNPENYLGTSIEQVENLVKFLREKHKIS
jgi:adenylosuccinate lyase